MYVISQLIGIQSTETHVTYHYLYVVINIIQTVQCTCHYNTVKPLDITHKSSVKVVLAFNASAIARTPSAPRELQLRLHSKRNHISRMIVRYVPHSVYHQWWAYSQLGLPPSLGLSLCVRTPHHRQCFANMQLSSYNRDICHAIRYISLTRVLSMWCWSSMHQQSHFLHHRQGNCAKDYTATIYHVHHSTIHTPLSACHITVNRHAVHSHPHWVCRYICTYTSPSS